MSERIIEQNGPRRMGSNSATHRYDRGKSGPPRYRYRQQRDAASISDPQALLTPAFKYAAVNTAEGSFPLRLFGGMHPQRLRS
jgi:hypothetical protein